MQVSVENTSNLERRVTVSLPSDRLDDAVGQRLREMAKTVRIKGFRPGKVPTKVIEQKYGDQVRGEAYGDLVRESFAQAVREQKLQIAGSPEFKAETQDGSEVKYSATFEIVPEFGEINVSEIEINRLKAEINDSDIDQMIETLQMQRRTWEAVERGAEAGDLVNLETVAQAADKRFPAEGVERGATVLGSNVMLAEIETALKGIKTGEEKTFDVKFPADWRVEDLAGKDAKVTVKAIKVSAPKVPEVDEAFIKSFGIKGGKLEKFREEVRSNLARELKGSLMGKLRAEVAAKLVAKFADVELPPKLIEAEANSLVESAKRQAQQRGMQNASYDPKEFMSQAKQRVAAGLLVGEIARQNNLKLEQKRVVETLNLIASTYEDPNQVIELYRNDQQLMSNLQHRVMEEQVIDWVAERAKATVKEVSFSDAIKPSA